MSVTIAMPRMSTDPELTTAQSKYVESLARAGAEVHWVALSDSDAAVAEALTCDGLLLPGGGDMDPAFYGQERIPACGEPNLLRDAAEPKLLRAFLAADKPVLGICRGIQVMNVVLGGTLYQDIKPFEHIPHNDHWAKVHTVTVRRGTLLSLLLGQDTVLVNSQHHQAADRIAPELEIAALSEDGIVEALEKPDAHFCVSFNVQNVTDEGNVIENLGIDRVVSISKSAQISRAESERDIAVAKANATKQANDARIEAETAIAERNNELEIKKQELKKTADVKKAEADAAYEIQQQEQRKTIEITTANANIAKQEKEIELREKEIAVKEKTLDADIRKQAEAEKYAAQQKADAQLYQRQKEAEAKQFEIQKQAEAKKAQAEADRFAKEQEAEAVKAQGIAEAEAIKAKGMADAESIKAKGLAEAEAMEKKAEAMAKYGKAAMTEMIIKVLPEMAEAIAKPLESIDKVTIIDGGSGENGVGTFSGNVPSVLAKTIESIKETTGFDLTEVMKANTYDAKTTKNVNFTGLPEGMSAAASEEAEMKNLVSNSEEN